MFCQDAAYLMKRYIFCASKQIGRAKTICASKIRRLGNYIKKEALNFFKTSCGADGTRTRDPMRDRHVF